MSASLLERRLHFVVGKGGVGKTTVAAALALTLARRGRRTLAVDMEPGRRLAGLLGREADPRLSVLHVDGRAALEEYLNLVIPVKRLLATVFASKIYQYFVAAAPGLKELMTVGKIWYEATRETFGAGLVQREASKITELLRDRRATAVHLVTLAEEMPVIETLEMRAQLTGALGLPLGYVIVNRLHRRRFDPAALERLRAAAKTAPAPEQALLRCVAERAAEESGWSDINAANLARLHAGIGDAPLVELPFLFVEEFGLAELEQVARLLEAGMAGGAEAATRQRSRSS